VVLGTEVVVDLITDLVVHGVVERWALEEELLLVHAWVVVGFGAEWVVDLEVEMAREEELELLLVVHG